MSLLKNFKDLGYFEDYYGCYFQYRKEHRSQPWPGINPVEQSVMKFGDFFLEWFYGYGTKPLNALSISIAIVLIFGIIWNGLGLGRPECVIGDCSTSKGGPDSVLEVFEFSATVFLSGTRLFIEPPSIPEIKGQKQSRIRRIFIFERILGALFSVLLFLAISGTIVR